ncbi:hypothetical protein VTO42DRAFT_1301 [Malbranchea cinnamomea]
MADQAPSRPRKSRSKDLSDIVIGDYQIVQEIGRGSFATVYMGKHSKSRTFVAIKSVNLRRLNKKLKDNLKSEIGILKGLHHPHIVALIDCEESSTHIHLVMEFCALGDLSLFIKKRGTLEGHEMTHEMALRYPNPPSGGLNEVVVRHFLKQLASALEFLRSKDLIHRDVKPQNLLLNPSPKSIAEGLVDTPPYKGSEDSFTTVVGVQSFPMLKIADFGFARSLPSTSLAETLCGSPLYMAPEILRYEKYDAKADLWSVGTVLYEMLVGKPPFRAGNHVELLRRIEKADDKIAFPSELEVSRPMKQLIRALLKRNPVERMNFRDFFESSVVRGDIPGLAEEDMDPPPENVAAQMDRPVSSSDRAKIIPDQPYSSSPTEDGTRQRTVSARPATPLPSPSSTGLRKPSTDKARNDLQRAAVMGRQANVLSRTPTAGTPEGRESPASAAMVRQASKNTESPGSSLLRERTANQDHVTGHQGPVDDAQAAAEAEAEREMERQRADQDVAFERDYVVVEKRQVEVNAFADELAASPRLQQRPQSSPKKGGAIIRRATTTSAYPAKAKITGQASREQPPTPPVKRRTGSFDIRTGPVVTSATSAISKALNMASNRLLGVSFSPPTGFAKSGRSPPLAYNPFPQYPLAQGSLVFVGEGRKAQLTALDEDSKTVQILEECATRSDVVYGFAEVKYKQLVPLTPSAQPDTAIRPGGISTGAGGDLDDVANDDLTDDAVVTLSEEGLVLYVKTLSLLAKAMDIAGAWWIRKKRGEAISDSPSSGAGAPSIAALTRINGVVQWVRTRFNECLQKAEYVRARLAESQKRLPPDHPSHPRNHTSYPVRVIGYGTTDGIYLSPGVTAERLIYERAVEMSKTAAINELANEDLPGCDISYVTAIRLLEAILESDDDPDAKKGKKKQNDDEGGEKDDATNGLPERERSEVAAVIGRIRRRLMALRAKMEHMEMMAKRASAATPTGKNGALYARSASPATLPKREV